MNNNTININVKQIQKDWIWFWYCVTCLNNPDGMHTTYGMHTVLLAFSKKNGW